MLRMERELGHRPSLSPTEGHPGISNMGHGRCLRLGPLLFKVGMYTGASSTGYGERNPPRAIPIPAE